MAGTAYQGTQITMNVSAMDHYLNTDADYKIMGVQWNWNHPFVESEPQKIPMMLTNDSSICFKEEKTETNAEVYEVYIIVKITK